MEFCFKIAIPVFDKKSLSRLLFVLIFQFFRCANSQGMWKLKGYKFAHYYPREYHDNNINSCNSTGSSKKYYQQI